ncbi:MAG TPA: IclR family transcriptional regulator [Thermosulfidibacter takaii]|uniref:IclR family transcriptional regulator n=1 Tax=Thermosulfidibacter takaii TaxID=412593 RepID=A0A7C0Y8K6_9BACT|nr:IclR family transcriptional regulator [Thermosulfidibacter takaii]
MQRGSKKETPLVRAVDHALQLLSCYTEKEEMGVTELSKKLGLHKNNVFRILATLEFRGYIEQNRKTEGYRLGPKIFELGLIFKYQMGLIKHAKPIMEEIVRRHNETVYLGVLRDIYAIYIDNVETNHTVRVVSRVGSQIPAYASAIGKVQLAHLPTDELERLLRDRKLRPYTERTIIDKNLLLEELRKVAEEGYAMDNEEFEDNVKCVAAPIRDYTRWVVAGLSISAPAFRMTDELTPELIETVKWGALQISKSLGYVP